MIKILNETKKRNIDSVIVENNDISKFYLVEGKDVDIDDEDGYLMAVSTEIAEYKEFATIMRKYKEENTGKLYMMCGGYSNDSLHLQYDAEV
mgnify:CR=1 FL=1